MLPSVLGAEVLDDESASEVQATLGLVPGTTVQAHSAQLATVAALTPDDGTLLVGDGSSWVAESGATVRASLGLGSLAEQDVGSVAIVGGAIDATAIGVSTPAAVTATTLATTFDATIAGGDITLGSAGSANRGRVVLHDADVVDDFSVALQAPDNLGADVTLTLPAHGGTVATLADVSAVADVDSVDGIHLTSATDRRLARYDATGATLADSNFSDDISGNTDVGFFRHDLTAPRSFTVPDVDVTVSLFAADVLDDASQADAQATLGIVPGTDVQAYDADLEGIARFDAS